MVMEPALPPGPDAEAQSEMLDTLRQQTAVLRVRIALRYHGVAACLVARAKRRLTLFLSLMLFSSGCMRAPRNPHHTAIVRLCAWLGGSCGSRGFHPEGLDVAEMGRQCV